MEIKASYIKKYLEFLIFENVEQILILNGFPWFHLRCFHGTFSLKTYFSIYPTTNNV